MMPVEILLISLTILLLGCLPMIIYYIKNCKPIDYNGIIQQTKKLRQSFCKDHKWERDGDSQLFVKCTKCGEEGVYVGEYPQVLGD